MKDYEVTVCAECLTASCWYGEFMCDKARNANVTTRLRSELDALNREHPWHYSPERLFAVTGYDLRHREAVSGIMAR